MKIQIKNNSGGISKVDITWVHGTKVPTNKLQYTQCKVKITNITNNEEKHFQAMCRVYKGENYNRRIGRRLSFKKVMKYDKLKEVLNVEHRTLIFQNFFSLSKKDANIYKRFNIQKPTSKLLIDNRLKVVV